MTTQHVLRGGDGAHNNFQDTKLFLVHQLHARRFSKLASNDFRTHVGIIEDSPNDLI